MNIKRIIITTLLLFFISPLVAQGLTSDNMYNTNLSVADSNSQKKKIIENRWHPYLGVHVSGDAGMYYIGPSFQVGTDFYLKERVLLSTFFQYFGDKLSTTGPNGFFENGKYRTLTATILIQANTSKRRTDKSFFMAAGLAIQKRLDTANTSYDNWNYQRTTILPAFRLGYFFPLNYHKLSVEINGTGPYSYSNENFSTLEIFTQLSLGIRYIF